MKTLLIGLAGLLLTHSAFATSQGSNNAQFTSRFRGGGAPRANVSLNFAPGSAAIPLVNDQPIVLNTLNTSSDSAFQFDSTTGTLTINRPGVYSLNYSFTLQNSGASASVGGVYATLNNTIIPNSSVVSNVGAGQIALFHNSSSFSANSGDKLNIAFNSSGTFQIPDGPANQGLSGPITQANWSPDYYTLTFISWQPSQNAGHSFHARKPQN